MQTSTKAAPQRPPADAAVLPREERLHLRRPQPAVFLSRVLFLFVLLGITSAAILRSDGALRLLFQVVQGALFAHGVELVHQCLHRTGTGRRGVDYALGTLLSWPAGISFWHYLYWHLWHHANNGTEEDAESFGYTYEWLLSPVRWVRIAGFAWHLSQLQHYLTAARRMALAVPGMLRARLRAETPAMPDTMARRIQRDYRMLTALVVLAAAASVAFRSTAAMHLWLVPLLVGYGPAHALIELPEHFLCARPTDDVFENTRSIRAGWLGRWYTNNNGNHVGHHYDALVPLQKTPLLERMLAERRPFDHFEETYPRYYLGVLRFLWTGRPAPAPPVPAI